MVYETKKNIRNIRNFENTKCRKHPIQHRQHFLRTAEKLGGGGGTKIHPSTPTPSLLPLVKKIGITSHRISQNTAEFSIDVHLKNFVKFREIWAIFEWYTKQKKTFEIYEISSKRNVVNTLLVGCPQNSVDMEFRRFFLLPSIPYSVRNWLKFRRNSAEFRVG